MIRLGTTLLLLIGCAAIAGANTFTADGGLLEPTHGYTTVTDRGLVNDGSFEAGTCLDGLSPWTCETMNQCDWIVDLVPLGLWNYDGNHIVWLGGFCGGVPTDYTSVCQEIDLESQHGLSWHWMAFLNAGGSVFSVTMDGAVIYEYVLEMSDHLQDYQYAVADTQGAEGVHNICFRYDRNGMEGDNYFIDFTESALFTAVGGSSFSTVKSIYRD